MLWSDRIVTGMLRHSSHRRANEVGERPSWRFAACNKVLRRHVQCEGVSTGGDHMGPNSVPPTSMDMGSGLRKSLEGSLGAASLRSTGKAPVINAAMMNELMFEYWAKKRLCLQSSSTTMDVDVDELIAALEGVEPKLS